MLWILLQLNNKSRAKRFPSLLPLIISTKLTVCAYHTNDNNINALRILFIQFDMPERLILALHYQIKATFSQNFTAGTVASKLGFGEAG